MNTKNLTDNFLAQYHMVQVITVYEGPKEGYSNRSSYYLESQEVDGMYIKQAQPMQEETISSLVKHFADKSKERSELKGFLPSNILYLEWNVARKVMVWYNKPQVRFMHFTNNVKIPSGEAMQPTIIYVLNNNDLRVYASIKKTPGPDDQLYIAPYHNCAPDGKVCLGSAKVRAPKAWTYEAVMQHWETIFWASEFSHLAGDNRVAKGNINLYWKAAIKNRTPFDNAILIESKITLKKSINA